MVRMKICLYVIHTIQIYFPINTLLRNPNSNHYDKVVRHIYRLMRQPLTKKELAEYGFLATFFDYNELNAIFVGLLENNPFCIKLNNMLLCTLPCKTLCH